MDTGDTETTWDGYYSINKYLYIRYKMGVYFRDPYQESGVPDVTPETMNFKTFCPNYQFKVAGFQYFDNALHIKPNAASNGMYESEELK